MSSAQRAAANTAANALRDLAAPPPGDGDFAGRLARYASAIAGMPVVVGHGFVRTAVVVTARWTRADMGVTLAPSLVEAWDAEVGWDAEQRAAWYRYQDRLEQQDAWLRSDRESGTIAV